MKKLFLLLPLVILLSGCNCGFEKDETEYFYKDGGLKITRIEDGKNVCYITTLNNYYKSTECVKNKNF